METPTNRTTMQTSKTSFARSIGSITSTDGCDHNGDVATTGSLTNTRKSGIRHSKSKIQDNCIRRTSCGTEVSSKNQRSLSHEQMACLKTALAVVVIKRRYQENQEMNEDSRGKKKNYNSDTRDPTLKLKDNQPELKINGVGLNGHSIDSSRQIISTTRSYPASSNLTKGDKLPYIVSSSCWHDHLHHLMQLARSTCEQLHNEKTYQSQPSKKEQQNNRYLLERFDGLATHLVCQLEHLQSCVASSNYGKVAISSSLEDTSGKHMKENKTSRGAIDIDDGANASNPKECNLTIGKDDKIDGDDAGSDDDARKFPPSIIELNKWILFHLTLSSLNDQSKYTNSIPKKYSNHCCDEVDPFVGLLVPFYPVWRKLLSLKPITISRLLVPGTFIFCAIICTPPIIDINCLWQYITSHTNVCHVYSVVAIDHPTYYPIQAFSRH